MLGAPSQDNPYPRTEMNAVTPAQEDNVGFGDKSVELSSFDRYKGRKNVTDRIAILSKTLIRGFSYFYESPGKKTTFRAPTNKETLDFVKKQLGEPTQKFALTLFHYLTDEEGNLIDENSLKGKVKVWIITENRYEELSNMAKQWPLLDGGFEQPQHDIVIKCTEEQFQRMTLQPQPKAHWKTKQTWYDALKAKEAKAIEAGRKGLGRQLADAEIMSLLGAAPQSVTGSTDKAGDIDLSDIVDA